MLSVNNMEVGSIALEHIQQRICHHRFYLLKKEPVKAPLHERRDQLDVASNLTSLMDSLRSLNC